MLKYSYVLSFYAPEGSAQDLYKFQQQALEQHTEQLSGLTEKPNLTDEDIRRIKDLSRATFRSVNCMKDPDLSGFDEVKVDEDHTHKFPRIV